MFIELVVFFHLFPDSSYVSVSTHFIPCPLHNVIFFFVNLSPCPTFDELRYSPYQNAFFLLQNRKLITSFTKTWHWTAS